MRTAVRFSSITAPLLFLCSTGVSQERNQSQTPRSEPEPPAVLKVTTRLVTVDVVARDRHGNPVRDLTAKDFQISEQSGSHKNQQQIASFRLLDRSLKNASDSESAALQGIFMPVGIVGTQKFISDTKTNQQSYGAPLFPGESGSVADGSNQFDIWLDPERKPSSTSSISTFAAKRHSEAPTCPNLRRAIQEIWKKK